MLPDTKSLATIQTQFSRKIHNNEHSVTFRQVLTLEGGKQN